MPDPELARALRQAAATEMYFAFALKGPDGILIVSRQRINPQAIAEAKKEIGAVTVVMGKCSGPTNNLVFQVAKAAPAMLAAVLKKVIQRDAGLVVAVNVQVAADVDE